ncbi:MAG: hypothetical protein ACTHNW_14005 [Mucilaginibacter sp.]
MVNNSAYTGLENNRPLILTLWMEEPVHKYFNEMRSSYFLPNVITWMRI